MSPPRPADPHPPAPPARRPRPLAPGQRAPDFVLPRADGTPTRFYAIAGGAPAVLRFDGGEVTLLTDGESEVLSDSDGKVRAAYGVGDTPVAYALDPNLRVLGTADTGDRAALDALLGRTVPVQAPVLLVPNVLDAQACAWLMDLWAREGAVDTGVESTTTEGRREHTLNAAAKRRRDLTVSDQETTGRIAQLVGRALMPEVAKAFAYRATRFEGFKIGCYDASTGGFFRAHRDNLSPQTAHRRFALTLNLNDGYTGGELRFPEYGPDRYRPPAGGALVFSCSLLHEVLDVTEGRRFVLLSFLYGDEATRRSA
jgi:predicted 2-oxoglutarate/Fe(II)-dependent dioxygenase YbiX